MSIQDLSGNSFSGGSSSGTMLGWTVAANTSETPTLKMYDFLLDIIRFKDQQEGQRFLERFLTGPQILWEETLARIFAIKNLWSVTQCPDEFLPFLKNIVGWTSELDHITRDMDADTLRKLIRASVPLWKNRGPEDTILNALRLVTGARGRIMGWFDMRWVFDSTDLGADDVGHDPWLLSEAGSGENAEFTMDVRIVDNGTLDRTLVANILKLMRPVGERFHVVFIKFLDLFAIVGDNYQWSTSTASPMTVANSTMKVGTTPGEVAIFEDAFVGLTGATDWTNYVATFKVRGSGQFGVDVYRTDASNLYRVELDITNQRVRLYSRAAGVETTLATASFASTETHLDADVYYGVRVMVTPELGTNRIVVYLDNNEIISVTNAAHGAGAIGVFHRAGGYVEVDEAEAFELPLDTTDIGINT